MNLTLISLLILFPVNNKQRKTLGEVFADPVNGAIEWSRIEALLVAAGCRCIEGSGSSVTFELNGVRAYFHRPHPNREALRYRVHAARESLTRIGVEP
jgi:hypothetical protein